MKKFNKFLALLLVAAFLFCSSYTNVLAGRVDTQAFASDIEYKVETNDSELCLTTEDSKCVYKTVINEDGNINITCVQEGLFRNTEIYDYTVEVINYDLESNILEYNVIDNNSGEMSYVNDSDKLSVQAAIVIGGGIALGELIIDALIAAAVVGVVAGITYYAATEVLEKVKEESKKNQKYYYYARIMGKGSSKKLCIGNAFNNVEDAKGYAITMADDERNGVFCVGDSSRTKAVSIAKTASKVNRAVPDDPHQKCEGYYAHLHPAIDASNKNHRHLHVWYD